MSIVNRVEKFEEHKINMYVIIVDDVEELWFKGKDVARVLKYLDTSIAINDHVDDIDRESLSTLIKNLDSSEFKFNQNDLKSIYININGIVHILVRSRMPNKNIFINWYKNKFGIDCEVITKLYKEQDTVGQIIQAFKHLNYETQYMVGNYRVDLYFVDYKLAIECDEFGHNSYNSEKELERETYIKNTLKCKFIRYNPDEPNFSVFNVINEIIKNIM